MSKVKSCITIYEDNLDYLKKVKEKKGLRSVSAAMDLVIEEHRNGAGDPVQQLANTVIEKIEEKYGNAITRCRLGINTADRNSQIMLEIFNSIILNSDMDEAYNTDVVESKIVKESKDIVKDRIARYKQIKDNKKH